MSPILIAIVTLIYAGVGILKILSGNFALATFLEGCAIANIGILFMARG